ncbi:hypothetical protein VPNG_05488 [Cytospora leucostoma]|uniref:Uncharacterized protein n=1 Tax=Cytospora leucostoma TaxID=1230097 RepID=A0A423XBE8_9PEZI|nr:hypothetical protein VPNG_05488 [Cytospora leucostoma]
MNLLNPKLAPKLTNDAPEAATKKKGVADEELAKKEAERARKRELDDDDVPASRGPGSKRQRSSSVDSVSTISTRSSKSPPPRRARDVSPPSRRHRRSRSIDSVALSETTGLAVATTDRPSGAIVQSLGEDNVRGLSSESVLLLVLDATHPTLMTDDPNNVAGAKNQDRRAVQVPETDVAPLREPTGNTGIEMMAEIRIEHNHQKLARRIDEFLRRNLSHHESAV